MGSLKIRVLSIATTLSVCLVTLLGNVAGAAPWTRHTVDNSSRGADGVRLADVNGDGQVDIATGWEEGGLSRIYVHPGKSAVRYQTWPAVTVGRAPSVEDAVFCDLDQDGAVDVVSSCEGSTKTVFVHWAPRGRDHLLSAEQWNTQAIPVTEQRAAWMFAVPMQVDGRHGVDLVVGSKGAGACVGWLEAPELARDVSAWKFHPLCDAGWIMSIRKWDMDGDGDLDLIISDRRGEYRGVWWLEHPGTDSVSTIWRRHLVGARGREVMFLDVTEAESGRVQIAVGVREHEVHRFSALDAGGQNWKADAVQVPGGDRLGTAKSVAWADLNRDGQPDLVYACEAATPPRSGVVWLEKQPVSAASSVWVPHDISGPEGIKFDRLELCDLDQDGDLDVLTCEERHAGVGLGVIWYENPAR